MIQADLHTHSIASGHAASITIMDMIHVARKKGLRVLGISDHGPATPNSAKLSYFHSLKSAPAKRDGIQIYYGVEANILSFSGALDIPDDTLANLDYAIVSIHHSILAPGTCQQNTDAYLAAMEHPKVRIIGHCDDARYDVDYEALVSAAIAHNVLLEINNSSFDPAAYRGDTKVNLHKILSCCKRRQYPVLLSSDSHELSQIGEVTQAENFLIAEDFPQSLVLNTSAWSCQEWLKK